MNDPDEELNVGLLVVLSLVLVFWLVIGGLIWLLVR
jgi:hypothetical protein